MNTPSQEPTEREWLEGLHPDDPRNPYPDASSQEAIKGEENHE